MKAWTHCARSRSVVVHVCVMHGDENTHLCKHLKKREHDKSMPPHTVRACVYIWKIANQRDLFGLICVVTFIIIYR